MSDGPIVERPLGKKRAICPACSGHRSPRVAPDDDLVTDADVRWEADGIAKCAACGAPLIVYTGGWNTVYRSTCMGCDTPLTGRQVKWCSAEMKLSTGYRIKRCSTLWHNPQYVSGVLARQQDGLCGICCLPLSDPPPAVPGQQALVEAPSPYWGPGIEVDHTIPVSEGGLMRGENLRTTHAACNQFKKAKSMAEARFGLGVTPAVLRERLADASPEARRILEPVGMVERTFE